MTFSLPLFVMKYKTGFKYALKTKDLEQPIATFHSIYSKISFSSTFRVILDGLHIIFFRVYIVLLQPMHRENQLHPISRDNYVCDLAILLLNHLMSSIHK